MVVSFVFDGKVRGQGRPRFTRDGHAYESKADRDYKAAIAAAYLEQVRRIKPFAEGVPLLVEIVVKRKLPKSKERARVEVSEPDTVKPDCDNIGKAVLDALNGLVWHDDAQVTTLLVRKMPRKSRPNDLMTVTIGIDREALEESGGDHG